MRRALYSLHIRFSKQIRQEGGKKHYKYTPDISFLLLKVIISLMSVLEGEKKTMYSVCLQLCLLHMLHK